MLRLLYRVVLLSACTVGSVAASDNNTEQLLAEVPEGWDKIVDRKVGDLRMLEYYPHGADDDWTTKLTVEALTGSDLPDPLIYARGLAEEQQRFCDPFAENSIFAGFENGYATTVNMLECGRSEQTGRGVLTLVKIIRGNQSLYTISRIWRVPPLETGDTPPEGDAASMLDAINPDELASWSMTLRGVRACDPALAAHPCPDPPPP